MQSPEIIVDQAELDAHCARWRKAGRFAFDTEFIRDDTYDAQLCLIQATDGDAVVLIDPTVGLDLTGFWALVTDPGVTAIVHAGKEDFELCLRRTGLPPRNVFDVQIAAGFAGHGYPLSLSRLVEQTLHRRIAKAQTLTDWLRRPLTREQLRYAVEDVAHLVEIHGRLTEKLRQRGRLAWALEEFEKFENPEYYRPPVQERLFKLKGSRKLDGLGLVVLERLIEWRDRWAQERNRPTRALMRDDVLVEIARRRPSDAADLAVLRGFHQAKNPKVVEALLAVMREARATPRSQWPTPAEYREETPMMKATVEILSAVTRAICLEEELSHELVGSTQRLRELIDHQNGDTRTAPPLLVGWRAEFIGKRLIDVLEGRSELHFSGWPDNPRLEVVTHKRNS
jgi:ribonuclease D